MAPRHNKTNYLSRDACSIARALEVVGERWNVLILREAFRGVTQFEDFRKRLGIAPNVLSMRLSELVENGVLSRSVYQRTPQRWRYELTPEKGRDLYPVIVSLMAWGDRWDAEHGPPWVIMHGRHRAKPRLVCDHCDEELRSEDTTFKAGPGLRAATEARAGGTPLKSAVPG